MDRRIVGARRYELPDDLADDAVREALGPDARVVEERRWSTQLHDGEAYDLVRRGATVERRQEGRTVRWVVRHPVLVPTHGSAPGPLLEWETDDARRAADLVGRAFDPLVPAGLGPRLSGSVRRTSFAAPGRHGCLTARIDLVVPGRGATGGQLRILELSPPPTSSGLELDEVDASLRRAGARDPAFAAPIAALLGPAAAGEADLLPEPLGRHSSTGAAITATLRADADLLAHHWPLLHLDPAPRSVHSARVALRRFRSHLRLFRPLVDHGVSDEVQAPARALATVLGPLRECDVLADLVAAVGTGLGDEHAEGVQRLLDAVDDARAVAMADLERALADPAHGEAVRAVVQLATAVPIVARADEPARRTLTVLTRRPWRRLRAAAARLDADSPVEALHELRLLAKRARYAAEIAGQVRPAAARHAAELRRLQRVLGELNDAAIANTQLRALGLAGADAGLAFTAGLVAGSLRGRDARVRQAWSAQWEAANRREMRGWLERS